MENERQKFQMQKKGFEQIVDALKSIGKSQKVDLNLVVEVNGAVIKDITIEDEKNTEN